MLKTLAAGRELDALVAEKVMGWRVYPCEVWKRGLYRTEPIRYPFLSYPEIPQDPFNPDILWIVRRENGGSQAWRPSVDIAAAWEVAERLQTAEGGSLDFSVQSQGYGYEVTFANPGASGGYAHADTAPLAICRAALQALGVTVP